ncbi:MAG: type III pantothenate kinase [Terrimicrobiaceae bacterium]|nr:type III pantothenate kinase [Terrimicrobiaceae bacterium]
MPRLLVIDISNTFTKFAIAHRGRLGRVRRLPTRELTAARFARETHALRFDHAVLSSVVPSRSASVRRVLRVAPLEIDHRAPLGIGIDYPQPASIGADRLANAVACAALHGTPAIVVDFGTAVTFDVISADGNYIGGVIAPGLSAMTEYLHSRTALLPRIRLVEPRRAVGKSTREAMLAGAVYGYRGLICEIVRRVSAEAFPAAKARIVATGGDAPLIAREMALFDAVDPLLTLQGLRIVGERAFA